MLNQKHQERNSTNNEFESIKDKFLFIADFNTPYSIWEKVISNFIDSYSSDDDVILIIYVDNLEIHNNDINYIRSILSQNSKPPLIAIETQSDFKDELELLGKVNYFITSRDIRSIKMIDYAKVYNVKVISGMKENIFNVQK